MVINGTDAVRAVSLSVVLAWTGPHSYSPPTTPTITVTPSIGLVGVIEPGIC